MNLNDISDTEKLLAAQSARIRLTEIMQSVLNVRGLSAKEQNRSIWCGRSFKRAEVWEGGGGLVDVYRNPNRDGANFAGLTRCGSVHVCAECSAKIGELRRKRLSAASMRQCKDNGGGMYLLTFTFPHKAEFGEDSEARLKETLDKLAKAMAKFKSGRKWVAFKEAAGNILVRKKNRAGVMEESITIGAVTSLEFTISEENGWHPHYHMLVFCKKQGFGDDEKTITEESGLYCKGDIASHMIDVLKKDWVEKLTAVGLGDNSKLTDMMKRALNVRGGEKAAEYIAKMGREQTVFVDDAKVVDGKIKYGKPRKGWSLSREVACTHAKTGLAGMRWGVQHFTPFNLLPMTVKRENETKEDFDNRCWAVRRFRDYAAAVEGRKALSWSRGLKAALGVEDVDEEEWAKSDQPRPEQVFVGRVNAVSFSFLLGQKRGKSRFLEYVATCCDTQEHLDEWLEFEKARGSPNVASGTVKIKLKTGHKVVSYA